MNSQEIAQLKKADQLMFTLNQAKNPEKQLQEANQLLANLGITKQDDSLAVILNKYNDNVLTQIRQIIKNSKHTDNIPDFNQLTFNELTANADEVTEDILANSKTDFSDYAQIVLRFDLQRDAWRQEKSDADYRTSFKALDTKRSMIHNNCLNDIKILNRMAESNQPKLAPFAVITEVMDRTNIGNAILEQYYEDLQLNEHAAFPNFN